MKSKRKLTRTQLRRLLSEIFRNKINENYFRKILKESSKKNKNKK